MAQWHPSPNFGPRRDDLRPSMVILHYTAMASAKDALARLSDPEFEVSAHYLLGRDGQVFQLVDEQHRAWHAGAGAWGGVDDINSRSIGIELDNVGTHVFSEDQLHNLDKLLAQILDRWGMPVQNIIGHSDMAPDRKIDPGRLFDWKRLAQRGLSVWPDETATAVGDFMTDAHRFGYSHDDPDVVLEAFRQRFRPFHTGSLDQVDRAMIHDLATRFPVDVAGLHA